MLTGIAAAAVVKARGAHAAHNNEGRLALVIGNAEYARARLRNATNDARAMAQTLRKLGFEVIQVENASQEQMLDAMSSFRTRSVNSDVRVFFYAGHGSQLHGRNYLIPVDARFTDEAELPRKAADATELVERLGLMKSGVNIVILDACRNEPFPVGSRTRDIGGGRSLALGLARVDAPKGTLVAFSTSPGSVANDGPGPNSAYTKHLLANLDTPGLPVEVMFKRVRAAVSEETNHKQIPWEMNSIIGDFCFRTAPGHHCVP